MINDREKIENTVYTIVRETMKYTATKILNSIERIQKDKLDCDVALRFSSNALADLILMATQGETQHQDFETFLEDEVDLAELYLDSGKYDEPDDDGPELESDILVEDMF